MCYWTITSSSISIAIHIGSDTVLDVVRLHVYYFDAFNFIDLQMMKLVRRINLGMHSESLSPPWRFVPIARARSMQLKLLAARARDWGRAWVHIVLAGA